MEILSFIQGYENANNKESYLVTHIRTTYLPYQEKIAIGQMIANMMYSVDKKTYTHNTPAVKLYSRLMCIKSYTDIEIDLQHSLEIYNTLQKYDLFNTISQYLPKSEYIEYNDVIQWVLDDDDNNNHSITAAINHHLDTLTMAISSFLDSDVVKSLEEQHNA